jgi:hypothetical protein
MDQNDTDVGYTEGIVYDVTNVLVLIFSVTGIVLNITTIMALMHLPWCSRPNLRLVTSMCVANIMFALNFLVYMIAYYTNPDGSGYAVTCLMFEVLRCVLYLYIYFNITSIVLDLYLAVTNPLGYASIVTKGRTNKLLMISAFISLVIMALAIIFNFVTLTEATNVHTHESSCYIYPNYLYIRSFNWIFKVSVFICIPVYLVLMIIIFLAVKATNSSSNSQPSNTRGVINERMFYVNPLITPLLYSLRVTDVRKGYMLMFKKCVTAATDYQSVFTGE